ALLAVLNGLFLSLIFIIQHDCGHQSFFKEKKLNKTVGLICSVFTSIPYSYWAKAHDFHHAHNGQMEFRGIGDIPTMTVEEYKKSSWAKKLSYRVLRSDVGILFIAPVAYMLFSNRVPIYNLNKGWKKVRKSQVYNNLILLSIYLGFAFIFGFKAFLLVQLLNIVAFGIIAFWFFYVQHQHEETYREWKHNWDHLLASIRGSTYYDLPKVLNWFTGNIGFHHIHHLNSRIPNYHLIECAKKNPVLQKYVTKVRFWESFKCLRNKLWDEEKKKMVGWREANLSLI
ncbi:MAG: fatty acid desaturase, partial [Bacteroidota bacterium]